jgi:hypothetical protein
MLRELPRTSRIFLLARNLRGFTSLAHWAWLTTAQKARIIHFNALDVLASDDAQTTRDARTTHEKETRP